jgi:hypothetical protein
MDAATIVGSRKELEPLGNITEEKIPFLNAKPKNVIPSFPFPRISPSEPIPERMVFGSPGSSTVVNCPLLNRKPWRN